MFTDKDRDVLDTFARALALEAIHRTGKKDYRGMEHYIIHEASYKDIVLEVFGDDLLMEQKKLFSTRGINSSYVDTDVDRAVRLSKIEDALQGISRLAGPIAIAQLAAGQKLDSRLSRLINAALGNQSGERGGKFSAGKRGGKFSAGKSAAAQLISTTLLIGGISFLLKLMFIGIEKTKSVCRVTCKRRIPSDDPNYKLKVKICARECKIFGFERRVKEMREQVGYCEQTENPEKCQTNLVKVIGKYNDFIENEKERLEVNRQQLQQRTSGQ